MPPANHQRIQYPLLYVPVNDAQLTNKAVIDKKELKVIFDFEIGISCQEPQAKRRKVQLEKEESKMKSPMPL